MLSDYLRSFQCLTEVDPYVGHNAGGADLRQTDRPLTEIRGDSREPLVSAPTFLNRLSGIAFQEQQTRRANVQTSPCSDEAPWTASKISLAKIGNAAP